MGREPLKQHDVPGRQNKNIHHTPAVAPQTLVWLGLLATVGVEIPFSFPLRDKSIQAQIKGYDILERPGTKMWVMFQRKRGRALFDL
jgi:hypothetical protein